MKFCLMLIWNSDVDCAGICNWVILLTVYFGESFFCLMWWSVCFACDKIAVNSAFEYAIISCFSGTRLNADAHMSAMRLCYFKCRWCRNLAVVNYIVQVWPTYASRSSCCSLPGLMRLLRKYRFYSRICRKISYWLFTLKVEVQLPHEMRLTHALRGSMLGVWYL